MTTLLIDADMLCHRSMIGSQIDCDMGDEMRILHSDIGSARCYFWDEVERMKSALNGTDYLLFWTGPSDFRRRIFPEYKANQMKRKPIGWRRLKDEVLQEENSYLHSEIEADDWLGVFSSCMAAGNESCIIVSGDKDVDQIAGTHYWPDKSQPLWTVTPDQAQRSFYRQILTGDPTDNVPGCAGVGVVTADHIVNRFNLDDPLECWESIVECFEQALKRKDDPRDPREEALLQARLTHLLRWGEYDVTTRTVDLWMPPTASPQRATEELMEVSK